MTFSYKVFDRPVVLYGRGEVEMGNNTSTKRITLVNDSGNIIQVSDAVVRRLKGGDDRKDHKATESDDTFPPVIVEHQTAQNREHLCEEDSRLSKEHSNRAAEVNSGNVTFQELENENIHLLQLLTEKLDKSIDDVEKKYFNRPSLDVCQEMQDKVLNCYENNSANTLNCHKEVAQFQRCVDGVRFRVLVNKQ
ncbi:MICOS complex subunit MIC19-like [Centruroides sculpturatus]|uniref:MICOS complex subunit MIC19-like n=1 Tax=Centruroides sculpturatus TaxID=218467 RepID=UPI000C6CEAFC|nr:MICOS complex subunit MIC19-like [Centruroides sculpturatus]XP_023231032.1 MICOS complex subunit MIC19-like [Centruroides sculpturatus]